MLRKSPGFFAVVIRQKGAVVSDTAAILSHIDVSDNAWARMAYLNQRDKLDGARERCLRLKIVPGGCRGFTYQFELPKSSDGEVVESFDDDVEFVNDACVPAREADDAPTTESSNSTAPTTEKFVIDGVSMSKLHGARIEFISNLNGMGFYVDGNKNVDKSCACKMSFSMREQDE